ncbi:hypothetical protein BTVI_21215 [Pitangus sulphuratus]|nr:hypothetical protein BTVI_21215 [Pitangus sulphuratus]
MVTPGPAHHSTGITSLSRQLSAWVLTRKHSCSSSQLDQLLAVGREGLWGHENRPSPKELEELELLNRALEKALKVRKSILKIPLEVPGATGKKLAGEGPVGKKAEEQQVPVPVEDVPESTKLLLFEFCSPKADFSPAEIEEELRVLQDVPSRLRQYVEAETAGPPTLQGEYESLLTLEGLQTTVAQCLQKLQLLRAALESQLRLRPDCTGDVGSCSPSCVPARGQMCDTAGVLALPLLCYSSFQELRDLFALKLQVSMLHQEIALQKVLMAELLPVLEPSPCPARLFRAIHTQLCQGGRSFPVLVRDELGD